MIFSFHENHMYAVWEVRPNGMLASVYLGATPYRDEKSEDEKKYLHAFELQLSGQNPHENHGAKHHGGSGTWTLRYKGSEEIPHPDGRELVLTLSDGEITYAQHFRFFSGLGVIRAWVDVTNISDHTVGLDYVASFSFSGVCSGGERSPMENIRVYLPHSTWKRENNWKEHTLSSLGMNGTYDHIGVNRIAATNSGAWSTKEYLPMGGMTNLDTHTTLLWQIEHNGSWHWEIGETNAKDHLYLKLSGPTDAEHDWHKELAPGATFTTVPVAVAVGYDLDSASADLTRYRRLLRRPRPAGEGYPVIFNDFMGCLRTKPTTAAEFPVIDRAAAVGADYYVIDAGWYAEDSWWDAVGKWEEAPSRFPGGLREVTDYIRAKGMIPGLWIEPEVMGVCCPLLDRFDDTCFFMRHGRRVIDHGRYNLDLRSPRVRRFLDETIDRLIADYGLGYMKFDYNIEPGRGTDQQADSPGDGLLEHNRAYSAWVEGVMDRHPDVIFENCSCGGMRTDYAQLSRFALQSTTDQEDHRGRAFISRAAALGLLPEQAGMWATPQEGQDTDAFVLDMVNTLPLRPYIGGRAWLWTEEQTALVAEAVACYRSLADMHGKAIAFYPQGLPSYDDGWLCVGYTGGGRTILSVWRMDEETERHTFSLPASYTKVKVLYPQKNEATCHLAGNELTVRLPRRNMAVLLELIP